MEVTQEKLDLIEETLNQLNEKVENDELTQWESVLMDTLNWVIDEGDEPTFMGRIN